MLAVQMRSLGLLAVGLWMLGFGVAVAGTVSPGYVVSGQETSAGAVVGQTPAEFPNPSGAIGYSIGSADDRQTTRTVRVMVAWANDINSSRTRAVAGAQVAIRVMKEGDLRGPVDPFFHGRVEGLATGMTNAAGVAELSVAAKGGDWKAMARHPDGADTALVLPGERMNRVSLAMGDGTKVFGRVFFDTARREAAEGATVRLFGPSNLPWETTADAEGAYVFKGMPKGNYQVLAWKDDLISFEHAQSEPRIGLAFGSLIGPRDLTLHPGRTIRGVVNRVSDRTPVAGATVKVSQIGDGLKGVSDANGSFRVPGLGIGHTEIKVDVDGFALFQRGMPDLPVGETIVNISLDDPLSYRIAAVDSDGRPVADVSMSLSGDDMDYRSKNTGSDGVVVFERLIRNGPIRLTAKKNGLEELFQELPRVAPDVAMGEFKATLAPAKTAAEKVVGFFEGTVKDESGAAIAGAVVTFGPRMSDAGQWDTVKAGAGGEYRLGATETHGSFFLFVTAKGYAPISAPEMKPGPVDKPTRVDFTLKKGSWVEFAVVDDAGVPVNDARIGLNVAAASANAASRRIDGIGWEGKTGEDGKIRFEDLPEGPLDLHVQKEGFVYSNEKFEGVNQEHRVAVSRGVRIRGRVIDAATKSAIDGAEINAGPTSDFARQPEGGFEMTVNSKGPFGILARANGYADATIKDVDPAAPIVIEMKKAEVFRGRLVSPLDGKPVAHARVYFVQKFEYGMRFNWADPKDAYSLLGDVKELQSNEKGEFESPEPAGEGTYLLDPAGLPPLALFPADRAKFPAGADGFRSIVFARPSAISGSLTMGGKPAPGVEVKVTSSNPQRRQDRFEQTFASVVTDSKGLFVVGRLGPGAYKLAVEPKLPRIDSQGRAVRETAEYAATAVARTVTLEAGESKTVALSDTPGSYRLYGQAKDSDGSPIGDVRFVLRAIRNEEPLGTIRTLTREQAEAERKALEREVMSDGQGRFEFRDIAQGMYTFAPSKSYEGGGNYEFDYFTMSRLEVMGDLEVNVNAFPMRRVTGRIALPANLPSEIRGAKFELSLNQNLGHIDHSYELPPDASRTHSRAETVLQDGRFEFRGRFRGEFGLMGWIRRENDVSFRLALPTIELDAATKDQDLGEIDFRSAGTVRVKFTFPNGGANPRYASVSFEDVSDRLRSYSLMFGESGVVTETVAGPIAAGRYRVVGNAQAFGFQPESEEIVIEAGKEQALVVRLVPEGLVRGQVVVGGENPAAAAAFMTGDRSPIRRIVLAGAGEERTIVVDASKKETTGFTPGNVKEDMLMGNSFHFQHLPGGTYRLTIEAEGFKTISREIEVKVGTETQLEPIRLEAAGQ